MHQGLQSALVSVTAIVLSQQKQRWTTRTCFHSSCTDEAASMSSSIKSSSKKNLSCDSILLTDRTFSCWNWEHQASWFLNRVILRLGSFFIDLLSFFVQSTCEVIPTQASWARGLLWCLYLHSFSIPANLFEMLSDVTFDASWNAKWRHLLCSVFILSG